MKLSQLLDHVLVVTFVAAGLYAVLVGQRKMSGTAFDERMRLGVYWSNGILLWLAGLATCVVWVVGGRSLAALGLTLHQGSVALGIAIAFVSLAWPLLETWLELAAPASRESLRLRWTRDLPFMPTNARELRHYSFMAFAAGVNEEIIARGFLISYLLSIFGESTLANVAAVTLPAIGFGLAHLYQGWKAVLRICVLSCALGAIFLITGSLLIPIVLHVIIDLFGGGVSIRLSNQAGTAMAGRPDDAAGAPPGPVAGVE
jgi:membrane protease YdiL (CAAX protease family)